MRTILSRLPVLLLSINAIAACVANDTIQRVHELELQGKNSERHAAIADLKLNMPAAEEVHWLSGDVRVEDQWVHHSKVADHGDRWSQLSQYREARSHRTDSAEDQYFLADGCRKHNLSDEERAHLFGFTLASPQDEEAHRRLGSVNIEGVWVTRSQAALAERQVRGSQAAYDRWFKDLSQNKENLHARSNQRRTSARKRLEQETDFSALPVMEDLFSAGTEEHQLLFKTWVCQFDSWKASAALARLAMRTESPTIRIACISELKRRRLEEYVPSLLASMMSPVEIEGVTMRFGSWVYYNQKATLETSERQYTYHYTARFGPEFLYSSTWVPTWNRPDANNLALTDTLFGGGDLGVRVLSNFSASEKLKVSERNAIAVPWNDRCVQIVSASTGIEGLSSAKDCWAWWNFDQGYCDVQKEQVFAQYHEEWYYSRRGGPKREKTVSPHRRHIPTSCFSADTPVLTEYGMKPIASISRGDRVLCQEIETGELAYQPVLGTTRRESESSIHISCGEDKLHCTPGHPFWVNGLGWRMADELEPGMRCHTLNGSTEITAVDISDKLDVYNLEVADFNTYFVGNSQVLTHDVTVRQPTDMLLPGLAKAVIAAQ